MIPRVLQFDLSAQFLDYVLHNHTPPTSIIICSTREVFIEQLFPTLTPIREEQDSTEMREEEPHQSNNANLEHLVSPTVRLIAKSRTVEISFCPELAHLRASLSVLRAPQFETELVPPRSDACRPLLAVLNLVALHHGTSEFSAQGLSRTFALAAETASREGLQLILSECRDVLDQENPDRGARLWKTPVPLLNGSVRIGGTGSGWAGRTVNVEGVARRWFEFPEREDNAVEDKLDA